MNKKESPNQAAQPAHALNWSELVAWWESGAEQWEGLRDIVSRMVAHAHAIDTSPEGWQLVPVEPTQAMWSELARDIVFWMQVTHAPHYGSKLHEFLRNLGREIPDWLTKEIPDVDHTPPKGTVAVCIYKAMLSAAPSTKEVGNGDND